jgi:hypothetical protein
MRMNRPEWLSTKPHGMIIALSHFAFSAHSSLIYSSTAAKSRDTATSRPAVQPSLQPAQQRRVKSVWSLNLWSMA